VQAAPPVSLYRGVTQLAAGATATIVTLCTNAGEKAILGAALGKFSSDEPIWRQDCAPLLHTKNTGPQRGCIIRQSSAEKDSAEESDGYRSAGRSRICQASCSNHHRMRHRWDSCRPIRSPAGIVLGRNSTRPSKGVHSAAPHLELVDGMTYMAHCRWIDRDGSALQMPGRHACTRDMLGWWKERHNSLSEPTVRSRGRVQCSEVNRTFVPEVDVDGLCLDAESESQKTFAFP
jgi:hypothetical protein